MAFRRGARETQSGPRAGGLNSHKANKKVAVVRLDALGDTLLSTPAIDALCRELGPENVLVLVSEGLGPIFGDSPPHREVSRKDGEEKIAQAIDEFGADTVYVFSEKKRALRGAFRSRASRRIGFDPGWTQPLRSLEVRRFLTLRFSIVNSLDSSSRYHEVERYCRLVAKGLSKKSINGGTLKFFSIERPSPKCGPDKPIAFQWAAKWLHGGWPERILTELAQALPASTRIFVSPEERDRALKSLGDDYREQVVCCDSLVDYAKAVAECKLLITIDTGAVHVAAAMGVAVVDVFPQERAHHTVPRWRPWMTPHRVVLKPSYQGESSLTALVQQIDTARRELGAILDEMKID